MWTFPESWEERLWAAVRAELPAAVLDLRPLSDAIVARSHRYTDERARLSEVLPGAARDRDLAARALFFTVADAAKVAIPVAELRGRDLIPRSPLRVLDVGAGVGAMTIGLAVSLPEHELRVTAVDRDPRALAILARVAASSGRPSVETVVADVAQRLPDGRFDLVVAGTVLNELDADEQVRLVHAMVERLDRAGAVIVVEPALRTTTRRLHELRDLVLAGGSAYVFAPCTRRGPCPALDDPRDWCHEDRSFRPPPRLALLMQRTGLRNAGLKFAYLTLRKGDERLIGGLDARGLRVVSGPLDQKGTVERIVCGDDGRHRLRLLKRDRNEANRELANCRRGDVILASRDGTELRRVQPAAP
jgi:ribosomal protein RSM22 (predicted rRNA methylase)